jgi:hypothetical protein
VKLHSSQCHLLGHTEVVGIQSRDNKGCEELILLSEESNPPLVSLMVTAKVTQVNRIRNYACTFRPDYFRR